ncbi:hypothetical protein BDY24DRAFT_204320 [Mrakia frigida]|uniref:uncharacterized protein n=1 Tax=Mrakia frigida TaxID=29902 RepID=UPI003FCC24E6
MTTTATLPAGFGGGGSIFWENLSMESLAEDHFAHLIAEHPSSPFYVPPLPRPTTNRLEPPTFIDLPPTRRMSISPEKKVSSPSSPKLSGWNFLKRHAGPSSLPQVVVVPLSTSKPRSSHQPTSTIGHGFPSASPNAANKRPGNSRSTTWTDNLPTTRALTLDQTPSSSSSPSNSQPPPPPSNPNQHGRQPYYPPSPHTAPPQPTYPAPPIVVVPSVLNQPRGRFGLFRRASMSPKVEKGGFFGFVGSEEKEKKRLKGLGLKKQKPPPPLPLPVPQASNVPPLPSRPTTLLQNTPLIVIRPTSPLPLPPHPSPRLRLPSTTNLLPPRPLELLPRSSPPLLKQFNESSSEEQVVPPSTSIPVDRTSPSLLTTQLPPPPPSAPSQPTTKTRTSPFETLVPSRLRNARFDRRAINNAEGRARRRESQEGIWRQRR